ncbi:MAG TPA: GNAT family N-acetyltransferase [Ohtaekwangia sp.]
MTFEIIEYENRYQPSFKALNVEWLEQYNLLESHDLEILNDPEKLILENGGAIYLVRAGDEIIGSAALMKEHEGVFELVKMAVAKSYQKMGISKILLEKCIVKARELRGERIVLFSNHQLKAALALYEKFGFISIPVENSPFATADIKMELIL